MNIARITCGCCGAKWRTRVTHDSGRYRCPYCHSACLESGEQTAPPEPLKYTDSFVNRFAWLQFANGTVFGLSVAYMVLNWTFILSAFK